MGHGFDLHKGHAPFKGHGCIHDEKSHRRVHRLALISPIWRMSFMVYSKASWCWDLDLKPDYKVKEVFET